MRQRIGLVPLTQELDSNDQGSKEVKKDMLELYWHNGSIYVRRFIIYTILSNVLFQIAVFR